MKFMKQTLPKLNLILIAVAFVIIVIGFVSMIFAILFRAKKK